MFIVFSLILYDLTNGKGVVNIPGHSSYSINVMQNIFFLCLNPQDFPDSTVTSTLENQIPYNVFGTTGYVAVNFTSDGVLNVNNNQGQSKLLYYFKFHHYYYEECDSWTIYFGKNDTFSIGNFQFDGFNVTQTGGVKYCFAYLAEDEIMFNFYTFNENNNESDSIQLFSPNLYTSQPHTVTNTEFTINSTNGVIFRYFMENEEGSKYLLLRATIISEYRTTMEGIIDFGVIDSHKILQLELEYEYMSANLPIFDDIARISIIVTCVIIVIMMICGYIRYVRNKIAKESDSGVGKCRNGIKMHNIKPIAPTIAVYPQQPQAYPQQPQAFPQQPQAYPQQPQAYPQQPQTYPQQPQAYPQRPQVYPQQPQIYPQQPRIHH